jgi:hypothetical protein
MQQGATCTGAAEAVSEDEGANLDSDDDFELAQPARTQPAQQPRNPSYHASNQSQRQQEQAATLSTSIGTGTRPNIVLGTIPGMNSQPAAHTTIVPAQVPPAHTKGHVNAPTTTSRAATAVDGAVEPRPGPPPGILVPGVYSSDPFETIGFHHHFTCFFQRYLRNSE